MKTTNVLLMVGQWQAAWKTIEYLPTMLDLEFQIFDFSIQLQIPPLPNLLLIALKH